MNLNPSGLKCLMEISSHLQGNIRVFCRVRPFIPSELEAASDAAAYHMQFTDDDNKVIELDNLTSQKLNDVSAVWKKK